MERLFEIWVFKMRPWMRLFARVIVFVICVSILGAIAGGVVSVWVRMLYHDI
jgi:hypothetical protein